MKVETYALLENKEVILGQGVGLSNDRDEIYTSSKPLHDLDVEGLEPGEWSAYVVINEC